MRAEKMRGVLQSWKLFQGTNNTGHSLLTVSLFWPKSSDTLSDDIVFSSCLKCTFECIDGFSTLKNPWIVQTTCDSNKSLPDFKN